MRLIADCSTRPVDLDLKFEVRLLVKLYFAEVYLSLAIIVIGFIKYSRSFMRVSMNIDRLSFVDMCSIGSLTIKALADIVV